MKKIFLVFTTMVFGMFANAQVPTNQDCLGAIQLCQNIYSQTNSFAGTGNYPNEINPALSCLNVGEKNDVWYEINIVATGILSFTIYPINVGDDYDWALYNLTNNSCADIYTNASLEVSCNYSGVSGNTGMNGLPGAQNNPTINVFAGEKYVLNVSNFTSTQFGYILDFTASTAVIYNNTTPPKMLSASPLSCPEDSITITFSNSILCSSVDVTDFLIKDAGGNAFPVAGVSSPNCILGSDNSTAYTLYFSPPISGNSFYNIILVDTVLSLCGAVGIFPDTLQAGVNAAFTVSDSAICVGDSILLSAISDSTYSYQWQLFGVDIPLATDSIYYAIVSGDYSLKITTSACGDVSSTPVTLTVDSFPVAVINPASSTSFCVGDSVLIIGNTCANCSYQWKKNGVPINGATSNNFVATQPGVYTMKVVNGCANISSNAISVTVLPQPDSTMSIFGSTNICPDDSVMISVLFNNSFAFQWFMNGSVSAGDTLNYIYVSQAGTYSVEVSSNAGCGTVSSTPVSFTINNLATFTLQNTTSVCKGGSVLLDATTLPSTLNFQWLQNGVPIPGATGQTFLVTDTGSYSLQYWNTCDTVISNSVTGIINPLPPVPSINHSYDTLICVNIAAAYQWYFNGVLIPGATSQSYIVTQNGSYTCMITDANGCTNISLPWVFNSVGLVENIDDFNFTIAPNPTYGNIILSFGKTISDKIYIKIISTTGSVVFSTISEKKSKGINHLNIDFGSVAPGVYVMEIQIRSEVYHQMFIKR